MESSQAAAVLQAFEYGKGEVLARIDGLGDDEFLWEPVDGCWTIRPVDGRYVADFVAMADPPPFTTIAWRLWHIGPDCLDSYARRAFGRPGPRPESEFVGTASEAVADLERALDNFVAGFVALGDGVWAPLGPEFGPFAEASYVDLLLHAHREVVHHGAEI
ncbi:MAG: DinB family protein, partial [Acidimicrobiales bacterium]